jgi:transcriptional regulator with XRE-family HTH domain
MLIFHFLFSIFSGTLALYFIAMNRIAFNLKELRTIKNLSQEALSKKLGITRSRLGAYEEGRNEPPIELLIQLSNFFHIPVDALIRADLSRTSPDSLMKIGKNRLLLPIMVDKENNDTIEVVTAKASAGYLNGFSDPEYIEKLPLMNLPFRVTGKHRTFPIQGDSMPPLKTGSFVVGKYMESLDEIKNGNTYILITKDEGIVYKRVYRGNNLSVLELHSDNKAYSPYKVKAKDILEIWSFVCCLHTSDKKNDEISMENVMHLLKSMKVEIESINKK